MFPSRRECRPEPLDANGEPHVLEVGIARHNVVIRKCVRLGGTDFAAGNASPAYFPEYEADGVHISHFEGIERGRVEALVEDLGRHVSPRSHSRVRRYVDLAALAAMTNAQTGI